MRVDVAGCDVNELDFCCESALVIPICQGDTEMVQLLLRAGCKLDSRAWGHLRSVL
jgi:ankyrin repeat protein